MDKTIVQQALAYLGQKIDAITVIKGEIDLTETNQLLRDLVEKEKEDIEISLDIV